MKDVSKTLYIPLRGKAMVSKLGIILNDPDAVRIWDAEGFPLKGKAASKWLAYYMGMRSAIFDRWLRKKLLEYSDAVVLHPGCGLDSRIHRVGCGSHHWYDLDFSSVIGERRRFFRDSEYYHMIGCDLRDPQWLQHIPKGKRAVIVMEGVSMYIPPEELRQLFSLWAAHFSEIHLLMDAYTLFAARASRFKNPINEVGVTQVYGTDDPVALCDGTGLGFLSEQDMTSEDLISQLQPLEQRIFRKLYAGSFARRLYRLWAFGTQKPSD